ncbi:MAG: ribonuclease P protein component [Actinomycetota bacterium]
MRPLQVRSLLDRGEPLHGARVVAFLAPGSGSVAFIVGRRVGGAVQRNRSRRILRAAWRQVASGVAEGYDIAWVARQRILGAKTQDLVGEMTELLRGARVMRP